jgi:hypothetical protein
VAARRTQEGLTLLQIAFSVFLAGSLLAAFVPTFVRELRLSKIAEAGRQLQRLHASTAAYFATPHDVEGQTLHRCLPVAAGPVPFEPTVEAHRVDFAAEGLDHDGFRAIAFEVEEPIRFSYELRPTSVGCDLRSPEGTYLVSYRAVGDLDGDGERSFFERRDRARDDADELEPVGILSVRYRTE